MRSCENCDCLIGDEDFFDIVVVDDTGKVKVRVCGRCVERYR